MPVSYSFEGRIFRLTNEGASTADEVIETFEAGLDDPAFPEHAILLWDIRESDSLKDKSSGELLRITQILGPKAYRHSNTSALVVSNDLYHGLMRMATSYGAEFESNSRLFRDEADALEWIDSIGVEDAD